MSPPPCCSDFSITTDDDAVPCVKLKVPSTIKQNPGGLKRSRGAQLLDLNPDILIYSHPDPFLDGTSILHDDAVYRQAVQRGKPKDKTLCDKFFLQLKHTNNPAAPKVCAQQEPRRTHGLSVLSRTAPEVQCAVGSCSVQGNTVAAELRPIYSST